MTDRPLRGRAALVTGVSRRAGIGFAVARRLLEMGAGVFAQGWTPHDTAMPWGADPGGAGAVLEELRAFGRVEYAEADFADPEAPAALVDAAGRAFGHVDILVANHARSGHGRLAETSAGELDAFLHENVRATVLLVQAFAAQHDGRAGGRVIMLTSGQHLAPMPRSSPTRSPRGRFSRRRQRWPTSSQNAGSPSTRSTPAPPTPAMRRRASAPRWRRECPAGAGASRPTRRA